MKTVVVLGGSGMLGSALVACLAEETGIALHASARTPELVAACRLRVPGVSWFLADAELGPTRALETLPSRTDWIVNAIGIIKPYIRDEEATTVECAIAVNALFPHRLAARARAIGARVIQIATDCVYSGAKGRYLEKDLHDATDVYGKTKSLGEVHAPGFHNLRCSIVGPEARNGRSLLEWFLGQPRDATVNGFTNHHWNGITTLHFARLVRGIIVNDVALPVLQHVLPADALSKAELLRVFATHYGREDVKITPGPAKDAIDRTLATADAAASARLWRAAGYEAPLTLDDMVRELATWSYPFARLDSVRT